MRTGTEWIGGGDYSIHWIDFVDRHRVAGHMHCAECPWAIVVTGDTTEDVHKFLIDRLVEHVESAHAEQRH